MSLLDPNSVSGTPFRGGQEPLALQFGLNSEEYRRFCDLIQREPTKEELAVCGALWSEHCSYKSSRVHLKRFLTTGEAVWQGPGENAGIVGINSQYGIAFKMESHNHPSYIEPYQGAATGVGGILRDVFCMGAKPIANLNALRFGEGTWNAKLLNRCVHGIADYGNSMGVPTVTGDTGFNARYSKNILVNAFNAGIIHKDQIFRGVLDETQPKTPSSPSVAYSSKIKVMDPLAPHQLVLFPENRNLLLYFGSATGRDGVHGATMSSAEFSGAGESLKPTVQVGDPFAEKVLMEATFALIQQGLVIGLQDMGAAGLTSSSVEMAGRSGCGVVINLNQIPLRVGFMEAFEILLSESQERMLAAVTPDNVDAVKNVLESFNLPYAIVGQVNDTGCFTCVFQDKIVTHTPVDVLVDLPPKYEWPLQDRSEYLREHETLVNNAAESPQNVTDKLPLSVGLKLPQPNWVEDLHKPLGLFLDSHGFELSHWFGFPDVASKEKVTQMYCSTVQGNTVRATSSLYQASAGVVMLPAYAQEGTLSQGVAVAGGCEERWVEMDPLLGAAHSTLKVVREIASVGAKPLALTDCLNFGSPRNPAVMRQFSDSVDGINLVCENMKTPVVSGNVSLNNQTAGQPIPPTPMIGAVGKVENVFQVPASSLGKYTSPHSKESIPLYWVNGTDSTGKNPSGTLRQSYEIGLASWVWEGRNQWNVTAPDFEAEKKLWEFVRSALEKPGAPTSPKLCRVVGHGGVFTSAVKMALDSQAEIQWDSSFLDIHFRNLLAEGQSGVILGLPQDQSLKTVQAPGIVIVPIGTLRRRTTGADGSFWEHWSKAYKSGLGCYFDKTWEEA